MALDIDRTDHVYTLRDAKKDAASVANLLDTGENLAWAIRQAAAGMPHEDAARISAAAESARRRIEEARTEMQIIVGWL
jgi:CHASE3 domain sensor protein